MSVCYYGPDGSTVILENGAPCPEGYADHPAKVKLRPADVVEAVAGMAASIAAFDHDGDGKPGGSKPRRKKAVSDDPRK